MAVMDYMKKKGAGILLGVVFVLSGFVKAVDPVGFSYKIEEYLRMFGWTEPVKSRKIRVTPDEYSMMNCWITAQ